MGLASTISGLFRKETWKAASARSTTPRAAAAAVRKRLDYRPGGNSWSSPLDIWNRGFGDCKDFATCVQAALDKNGIWSEVRTYFSKNSPGKGHAVAAGGHNGQLWFSSNGSYQETDTMAAADHEAALAMGCHTDQVFYYSMGKEAVDKLIALASNNNPKPAS